MKIGVVLLKCITALCSLIGISFLLFQMDDDIGFPQAAAPKQKDASKEEPSDNSPSKPVPSGSARGTPSTAKSAKGKRKLSADDAKTSNNAPPKKVKSENV